MRVKSEEYGRRAEALIELDFVVAISTLLARVLNKIKISKRKISK